MTRLQALKELERKVEAGDIELKDDMAFAFGVSPLGIVEKPNQWKNAWLSYNGSLDAAQALHEALLPGWMWARAPDGLMMVEKYFDIPETDPLFFSAMHRNPARAWLLAILKALIAQETNA